MQQPFSKFRLAQFGNLVKPELLEVAAWSFSQHLAVGDPTVHGQCGKYQRVLDAKWDTCLWPLGWDAGARRLERKCFCRRRTTLHAKGSTGSAAWSYPCIVLRLWALSCATGMPLYFAKSITNPIPEC